MCFQSRSDADVKLLMLFALKLGWGHHHLCSFGIWSFTLMVHCFGALPDLTPSEQGFCFSSFVFRGVFGAVNNSWECKENGSIYAPSSHRSDHSIGSVFVSLPFGMLPDSSCTSPSLDIITSLPATVWKSFTKKVTHPFTHTVVKPWIFYRP